MSDLSVYRTNIPAEKDFIADMYLRIRLLAIAFKDRWGLDHAFDGTVDTSDSACDGYHKKLTMESSDEPTILEDSGVLYCGGTTTSVLYFKNESGVVEII